MGYKNWFTKANIDLTDSKFSWVDNSTGKSYGIKNSGDKLFWAISRALTGKPGFAPDNMPDSAKWNILSSSVGYYFEDATGSYLNKDNYLNNINTFKTNLDLWKDEYFLYSSQWRNNNKITASVNITGSTINRILSTSLGDPINSNPDFINKFSSHYPPDKISGNYLYRDSSGNFSYIVKNNEIQISSIKQFFTNFQNNSFIYLNNPTITGTICFKYNYFGDSYDTFSSSIDFSNIDFNAPNLRFQNGYKEYFINSNDGIKTDLYGKNINPLFVPSYINFTNGDVKALPNYFQTSYSNVVPQKTAVIPTNILTSSYDLSDLQTYDKSIKNIEVPELKYLSISVSEKGDWIAVGHGDPIDTLGSQINKKIMFLAFYITTVDAKYYNHENVEFTVSNPAKIIQTSSGKDAIMCAINLKKYPIGHTILDDLLDFSEPKGFGREFTLSTSAYNINLNKSYTSAKTYSDNNDYDLPISSSHCGIVGGSWALMNEKYHPLRFSVGINSLFMNLQTTYSSDININSRFGFDQFRQKSLAFPVWLVSSGPNASISEKYSENAYNGIYTFLPDIFIKASSIANGELFFCDSQKKISVGDLLIPWNTSDNMKF